MYIINIMVLYEINIFNFLRTALLKLILLFGNFVGNYKKLQKGTLGLPQKKMSFSLLLRWKSWATVSNSGQRLSTELYVKHNEIHGIKCPKMIMYLGYIYLYYHRSIHVLS